VAPVSLRVSRHVDYASRQVLTQEAKIRIARKAAEHLPDNPSLFIRSGTTTDDLAKALIERTRFNTKPMVKLGRVAAIEA